MAIALQAQESPSMRTYRIGILDKIKSKFGTSLEIAVTTRSESQCETVYKSVSDYVDNVLLHKKVFTDAQKRQIRLAVMDEVFGFGPLGLLLRRPEVGSIYLEGPKRAYVEIFGERGRRAIEKIELPFDGDAHVLDVIDRIMRPMGKQLSDTTPTACCTLPNGTRVFASIKPVSVHGPTLSIVCRKQTTTEIAPHWQIHFLHFDEFHEAKLEKTIFEDREVNAISLKLTEPKSGADVHQRFSARSFCGKKVRFCGAIKFMDDPPWCDPDLPEHLEECYRRAEVYVSAVGRGGKCLAEASQSITLSDQIQNFESILDVPPRTAYLKVGVKVRGPISASIFDLSFQLDGRTKTRIPQGPRNLQIEP